MASAARVYCSEHPDQELTPAYSRVAPVTVWGRAMECTDPRHGRSGRHRCAWCGRQVFTARSISAVYCGGTCRVAAHRARQRELAATTAAELAASPSGTDPGGTPPPGDAHPGRSS